MGLPTGGISIVSWLPLTAVTVRSNPSPVPGVRKLMFRRGFMPIALIHTCVTGRRTMMRLPGAKVEASVTLKFVAPSGT